MAVIRTATEFTRWCEFAQGLGLPIEVSAKRWKATRTTQANAYLHGVAYKAIAEATGYSVDEIHEYVLGRHYGWVDKPCPKTPRNPEGIQSVPFRTTTKDEHGKRSVLSKKEFGEFMDTVMRVAAQAGVFIPDPDQGDK